MLMPRHPENKPPDIGKFLGPHSFIQQSNHKGQNTSTSGIATTSTRMLRGSPRRQ
jgi:hypothetical protein